MKNNLLFVLGGAYSGKTAFAEQTAQKFEKVSYFGTLRPMQPGDEIALQLNDLKTRRPAHWKIVDAPFTFDDLKTAGHTNDCLVIDCLTMWLAWCLTDAHQKYALDQLKPHVAREFDYLMQVLVQLPCTVILVSGEVGSGVVPTQPSARMFRELVGKANLTANKLAGFVVQTLNGNGLLIQNAFAREEVEIVKKVTPAWLALQLAGK